MVKSFFFFLLNNEQLSYYYHQKNQNTSMSSEGRHPKFADSKLRTSQFAVDT